MPRSFRRRLLSTSALLTPLGLLLLAAPAAAQEAAASTADPFEVVVESATLTPTPEGELGSSVTVITAEEIARNQWRTVPDALNTVPGLNMVQSGGPGGTTSIFIRGTNSNHVKVLIDGIDYNDPSTPTGTPNLDQLLTGDVARIEVLRGPQSGLYGSDAIGGVISISTRKGEGPAKFSGYAEIGSLGTFNQSAGVSGSQGATSYNFNVTHYASTSIPVTPQNIVPLGWPRNPNAYDNWTYAARIDHTFSDAFSINLTGRYIDSQLKYTPDIFPPPFYIGIPSALRSTGYNSTLLGKAEGIWTALDGNLVSTFGLSALDISRPTDGLNPSELRSYDGDRQTYYWRSLWTFMPGQSLLVGVERQNENMTSRTAFSSLEASTGDTAGYAQYQGSWADRFFLAANVRHDSDDDFGDHTTWRVAPAILIPETGTRLKASYGTGFKAPTLFQLYQPIYGNPNLRPEESEGWDAGFEQELPGGVISFGATYFHNDITNLVSYDPVTWQNVNISSATSQGVEAFVAVKVTDQFKVRADYTYTEVIGYFPPGMPFGASCAPRSPTSCYPLRRPNNKLSLAVDWQATEQLSLTGTLVYVSDWWDVPRLGFTNIEQPGYTVVNIAANYKVNEFATVFGRIDNLFDQTYEVPHGWLAPGFGAFAGLKLTY